MDVAHRVMKQRPGLAGVGVRNRESSTVRRHEPDVFNLLSRALLHFDNDLNFTLDAKNLFYTYLSAMQSETSREQGRRGSAGHKYREYAILSIVAVVSLGHKQCNSLI